jgi:hypothetical protein
LAQADRSEDTVVSPEAPQEQLAETAQEPVVAEKGRQPRAKKAKPISSDDLEDDEDEDHEDHEDDEVVDGDDAALQQFIHDDPLAPGYDLEGGELLNQQEVHLPWQTDVSTPKEFFTTELLYRFDVVEPADRQLFDGTYCIEIKGEEMMPWSITVGEELKVSNTREEAEIVLKISETDFMELVNGRLNPQLAILAQKMKVDGEVKKAVLFQELLIPAPE